MEPETTPIYLKIGGAIFAMLGSAFGLGKYNASLVKKKELYKDDGSPIYLAVDQFEKQQVKINETLDKIGEVLQKRYDEDLRNANILGRIEQFMENNK